MKIKPNLLSIHEGFPLYEKYNPKVPVYNLTPNLRGCFHRFFDTSPISPSGRYAAFLQMPDETRSNEPGEKANIVLVDLQNGPDSTQIIYETAGWEPQMGANINWGADDNTLVFNDVDVDTWEVFGVRLNPHNGDCKHFEKGVYHLSPDGRLAACCSLNKMPRTQYGYGVRIPEELVGLNGAMPDDDGVYIVDIESGKLASFVSISELHLNAANPSDLEEYQEGWHYGFHAKWSPAGDRLLFTTRWVPRCENGYWNALHKKSELPAPGMKFNIFTMTPDGKDIMNAVPAKYWEYGGHHINWYPDGSALSMNLGFFTRGKGLNLVRASLDGSEIAPVTEVVPGSGHPSFHPDGCHVLTDCYQKERWCRDDGSTPLRWIDLKEETEEEVVRFCSNPGNTDAWMRLDPHPAWNRDWSWVSFNAVLDGTRRVLLADMRSKINANSAN